MFREARKKLNECIDEIESHYYCTPGHDAVSEMEIAHFVEMINSIVYLLREFELAEDVKVDFEKLDLVCKKLASKTQNE